MSARHELTQHKLGPGARLALFAPASPFDVEGFELGVARLRRRYEVLYQPEILTRSGYLAGDDGRRLGELRRALQDASVAAVIAARGGYGCTRFLQLIAAEEVHACQKLLVGFSDLTALHALWAQAGVGSIHGNMVAGLGRCSELQFARYCAALEGCFTECFEGLTPIVDGVAEGVLLGGNLAVLSALIGTAAFPPLEGAVLFLEDVTERPYRIDRMLTTWRNAGAFRGVRGVVLGGFTQCDPGPDGVTVEQVLRERLSDLGIPVAAGLPAGHVDDNHELPFGRAVTLDAGRGRLYLHVRSAT
ncbi:MAG: LD-carboxypeptidase [Polyangiales bacterium]